MIFHLVQSCGSCVSASQTRCLPKALKWPEAKVCGGWRKSTLATGCKKKKNLTGVAIGCKIIRPGCSRVLSGDEQLGAVHTSRMQPEPQVLPLKVVVWGSNIFSPQKLMSGSYQGLCNSLGLKLDLRRTRVEPSLLVRYKKGLDMLSLHIVPRNGYLLASLRPQSLDIWFRTWAE